MHLKLTLHASKIALDHQDTVELPGFQGQPGPGLWRPILKNLGFFRFFKKPKKLDFWVFWFSSQNFYFFVSNSVDLFELIGIAIIS